MKKNTHLPIAAKIRVEGNSNEKFHAEIVKVISESGVDFLIVHGRHWTETYKNPCHYEQIKFFVDTLKIPVIGNGDVFCIDSLKKMFATGCAGVMIARAGIGRPWLIQKLIAEMKQQEFVMPSCKEIGDIFLHHVYLLEKVLGSERVALLHARKIASVYAQGVRNKKEFCCAVNGCESLQELQHVCLQYLG